MEKLVEVEIIAGEEIEAGVEFDVITLTDPVAASEADEVTNLVSLSKESVLGASAHAVAFAYARTYAKACRIGQEDFAERLLALINRRGWALDIVGDRLTIGEPAQLQAWATAIVERDTQTCAVCGGRGFVLHT